MAARYGPAGSARKTAGRVLAAVWLRVRQSRAIWSLVVSALTLARLVVFAVLMVDLLMGPDGTPVRGCAHAVSPCPGEGVLRQTVRVAHVRVLLALSAMHVLCAVLTDALDRAPRHGPRRRGTRSCPTPSAAAAA